MKLNDYQGFSPDPVSMSCLACLVHPSRALLFSGLLQFRAVDLQHSSAYVQIKSHVTRIFNLFSTTVPRSSSVKLERCWIFWIICSLPSKKKSCILARQHHIRVFFTIYILVFWLVSRSQDDTTAKKCSLQKLSCLIAKTENLSSLAEHLLFPSHKSWQMFLSVQEKKKSIIVIFISFMPWPCR